MNFENNNPTSHIKPTQKRIKYRAILILILLLSASLRLYNLRFSPPGLNQDEAANAWNAYCLLKSGQDQTAASWPIFSMRGLGGYRTTLHVYLLMPFQAIGGLNIITTRLPAAIGGIFTILLVYFVAHRLFDQKVALISAAILALNPWHLQQSRWGHDAALCALLGLLPLAMLLWANIPIIATRNQKPKPIRAVLAGVVTGICCYGYHAMRLFIPTLVVAIFLVTLKSWWPTLKNRAVFLSITGFILAFVTIFAPLAYKHVYASEEMGKRGQMTLVWEESDSILEKTELVLSRYVKHFGLDFLFIRGDHFKIQSPPSAGQFHWYSLPLMILGAFTILSRLRYSFAARILLVYVLVYPIGDCFNKHMSLHALRSLPGLCGLVILAAVGAVCTTRLLYKQGKLLPRIAISVFAVAVIGFNVQYLNRFFRQYNHRPEIYHRFNVDLLEACQYLKADFDSADAVFCTTDGMNQPYIITLVALEHKPKLWFSQPLNYFASPDKFDTYASYGKMHFMYGSYFLSTIEQLKQNNRPDHVIFIVRPGELGLSNPTHKIYRPDGQETLWVCQSTL